MQRFFQPNLEQHLITLNEDESKHAIRVLRLKQDNQVELIDGKGTLAIAQIIDDHPKRTQLEILKRELMPRSHHYSLHLMIAPAKNPERNDWLVEKAMEAGIDNITFIETANTERNKLNLDRLTKIAVSAMKQSKQYYLPKLSNIIPFNQVIASLTIQAEKECRLMAWCEEADKSSMSTLVLSGKFQDFVVLVGPEGDFTKDEVHLASKQGFTAVGLGNSILRTETAGVYVTMALRALMIK